MHERDHDLKKALDSLKPELVAIIRKGLEQLKEKIMAKTQADLDAAIAALPQAIETQVEAALGPIIQSIQNKASSVDLSAEIDALNAVAGTVATKVASDLTPPPAAAQTGA